MNTNTFSIIAFCKKTGQMGGASASYFPAIGAFSPYIRIPHGVITSQGWVNPFLNATVMDKLVMGETAENALHAVMKEDDGKNLRQISVVDGRGNTAAFTGKDNDNVKLHIRGDGYVIAGNLLTGKDVLYAMEEAFVKTKGHLSDRLINAMIAGDKQGGDKRGKRAACIKVDKVVNFPYIDYRVDDAEDVVKKLNELYQKNKEEVFNTYDSWVENVRRGIKGTK